MNDAITEKTSRKEQIIDVAFSLVQTNDRWSLAEVALKIGVSKTAIYRHFKNRAEIEEEMDALLCKEILEVIEKTSMSAETLRNGFASFFRTHPGHFFLFMHNNLANPGYDQKIYAFLEKESPQVASFSRHLASLPQEKQDAIYIEILKNAVSVLISSFQVSGIESLQNELLFILARGFPELTHPSAQRLGELELLSQIAADEICAPNKLFDAIALTIRENGIAGTTIERIAEKMGTAKSSLYFYFKNKNEMICELIKKESDTIITLCAARAKEGKTLAEQLFIIMSVQANYLLKKTEMIPVFNWIRYETIRKPPEQPHTEFDIDAFLKPYLIRDLFPNCEENKYRAIGLLKWTLILSASTIIQGQRLNADEHTLRKNIRTMYTSILNGDKEIL